MPIVQETLLTPDGDPLERAKVSIRLVASTTDESVGYHASTGLTGLFKAHTDALGYWSAALTPNADLSPAGTVYAIHVTPPGRPTSTRYVSVPSGPGPYDVATILAIAPGALPLPEAASQAQITDLQNQIDTLEVGSSASYRHVQSVPASVWTVVHNLGFRPGGIYVEDSGHAQKLPRVAHIDVNTLTLSFFANGSPVATGGEADIS